jgi:hypothetical protein
MKIESIIEGGTDNGDSDVRFSYDADGDPFNLTITVNGDGEGEAFEFFVNADELLRAIEMVRQEAAHA